MLRIFSLPKAIAALLHLSCLSFRQGSALLLAGLALLGLSGCLAPAPGSLQFQDDFADPSSGWALLDGPQGKLAYAAGVFQIQVALPGLDLWSTLPAQYRFPADVQIELDVQPRQGPEQNWFGVLCRYQDERNFYWAVISSDGYYGLGKLVDGERSLLHGTQLPPSEAIRRGAETNHLRLDCRGETLSLYINGVPVEQQSDSSLKSGGIGLLAGLDSSADVIAAGPLTVEFDRLTVLAANP